MNDDLPRVTQILRGANLMDSDWWSEAAMLRGRAVHLACQYYDEGDLDPNSIDPRIEPFVRAYIDFRGSYDRQPEWIERPLVHPARFYRGTPDRVILTRPCEIWEIKTGSRQHWHALQVAAYVQMLEDEFSYRQLGIYLREDGTFSVHEFPRSDYLSARSTFLNAVGVYNWRRQHGD